VILKPKIQALSAEALVFLHGKVSLKTAWIFRHEMTSRDNAIEEKLDARGEPASQGSNLAGHAALKV